MNPDLDEVAALIRRIADEEALSRFRNLAGEDIAEKAPGDLVTVADLAVERRLTPELQALLPGSLVVGEEAVAADPASLDQLQGDAPVWIIDPIDGTANFAVGIPLFAIMVALSVRGRTEAGWIYDPVSDRFAIAGAGAGAFLHSAGTVTRLRAAAPVPPASMGGGISFRYGDRELAARIARRADRVGTILSYRCAGQDYVTLAEGRTHFSLYHRIMPWDHAAGVLIHKEAGGCSKLLDGSPYSVLRTNDSLMMAPDEASWHALYEALLG